MRPEGRWYAPLAGFLCAALLGAACLLFVSMLGTTLGPFRFDSMLQEGAGSKPLGLWHPAASSALGDAAAQRWRGLLPHDLLVLESARLSELLAADANPIVVSDARALVPDELDALLARARSGGAVVLAGWVAVRDGRGPASGRAAMARLLGVAEVAALRSRRLARGVRGPLASGIEVGLELPEESAVPGIPGRSELHWTDAQGAPAGAACGALRLVRVGSGAVLWIAALPADPADRGWRSLYRSAFAAALGRPSHEVLPSPTDPALSGSELAAWTRMRAEVYTELESITPHRVQLHVTNGGRESARAIAVRIYLNRRVLRAVAQSSTLFTRAPQLRRGLEHVDLELPPLAPGASRTYVVDVEL